MSRKRCVLFVIFIIILLILSTRVNAEEKSIRFNVGLDLGYSCFWQPLEVETQPGFGRAQIDGDFWQGVFIGLQSRPFSNSFILGYNLEWTRLRSSKSETSDSSVPKQDWRHAKTDLKLKPLIHELYFGWVVYEYDPDGIGSLCLGISLSIAEVDVQRTGLRFVPKNPNGEIIYQPEYSFAKYKGNIIMISPSITIFSNNRAQIQMLFDYGEVKYDNVGEKGLFYGIRLRFSCSFL